MCRKMNVIVLALCFLYIGANYASPVSDEGTDGERAADIREEMRQLREDHDEERAIRLELQNTIRRQQQQLETQGEILESLQTESSHASAVSKREDALVAEPKSRFTGMGCLSEEITLTCPGSQTIALTDAILGEYAITCSDGCCPPNHHTDCTVLLSVVNNLLWEGLKLKCNGKKTCTHLYNALPIAECGTDQGDYMQIYYDCTPVDQDSPVGFTAHASTSRVYAASETIVFDKMESNFGSGYNPKTCSFHCPHKGIYLFSITFQTTLNNRMDVELVKDDKVLSQSLAFYLGPDDISVYNHAGTVLVVECDVGEVVWARSGSSSSTLYGTQKHSQFSGYLLQKLS